jgi:hypothetical protein
MRSIKEFTIDIVRKPPILFPLVGLFHILWLLWVIWSDHTSTIEVFSLQVAWMIAYTFFWIAVCDFRKWGAIGYFALTLLNTMLYLAGRNYKVYDQFTSNIVLIDALFCFFIFIYYKRLR